MNAESLGLWLSFVVLLLIPCGCILATVGLRRVLFKKNAPPKREVGLTCLIAAGITVVITLAICVVFSLTGFFESQFYRPSHRDFGKATELKLTPEEVAFKSSDGTQLHGWFLKAAQEPVGTVIAFHGSDRNITYTVANTHWLTERGFNLFVFDYRGYGQSKGTPSREGLIEDCVAAIETIRQRPDIDSKRLILYGQSMGGQLAIAAAGQARDLNIQLVISEATYASHRYHLSDKLGRMGPLWLVKWGAWLLTSDEGSAEQTVEDMNHIPLLLIHGTADRGVSPYHSDRIYRAASDPKEIWRVEDAGHLQIFGEKANQDRLSDYLRQILSATE